MQAPAGSISPALEVPIDGLATGGFHFPITALDQDSGNIAIAQLRETWPFWSYVKYQSADWLAWLFMATVLVVGWRLLRIVRTPRAKGRLLCRRCEYDLTPVAGAALTETCPECGVQTAKRPPVVGTSRLQRCIAPLAVLLLVAAALAVSAAGTLEPVGPVRMTRLWPPLVSPYLPGWLQRMHREPSVLLSERVDIWSASSGRRILSFPVQADGFPSHTVRDLRFLSSGSLLGITLESSGIRQQIVRVSDGEVVWKSAYPRTQADVRSAGFAGASQDGSRAYVWRQVRRPSQTTYVTLDRVDLQTGVVQSVGSLDLPSDPDVWGLVSAVAAEQHGGVVWAALVQDRTGFTAVWEGGTAAAAKPSLIYDAKLVVGADGGWTIEVLDAATMPQQVWTARIGGTSSSYVSVRSLMESGGSIGLMRPDGSQEQTLWAGGATVMRAYRKEPRPRWVSAVCARQSKTFGLPDSVVQSSFDGCVVVWKLPAEGPSPGGVLPAPAPARGDK